MILVHTGELPPESLSKSLFLAGPTPRSKKTASWRPEAIGILQELRYDGVVFVPELRNGAGKHEYVRQVEWEEMGLNMADCNVFWVPRKLSCMPAFTTNIEWGVWQNSGKAVFGAPPWAAKVDYQKYYANKLEVPLFDNLRDVLAAALEMIGDGAARSGGERQVPLYIWRTDSFQQWYRAQKQVGNRLDGAKVEWTVRYGPKRNKVFLWALHVNVHVTSEKRNKINEVVLGRPDIATILMYRPGKFLDDSDIVLIREFRSPVSNESGFVWEIPGGSSLNAKGTQEELAAEECKEETGIAIDPSRIRRHEERQLVATLSAHKARLFSVRISEEELNFLRSQYGKAHGVVEDSERTYIEFMKLTDLRRRSDVDWSMLGMILSVLTND